jgi:O-antigen/teichoic acid export membrane protein
VREGSLIFIMNALMIIRGKVDIIMLSRLQSDAAVGIFGVAKKATDYLRIFREGATGAVFPRLSSIQTDSPSAMGDVFGKIIGFFVLIYLPVVVLISFLSKDIIQILFGDKFVIGSTSLVILVWALFLNILSGPAAMLIIITKEKLAKFVPFVFFLTVFHILLNFWLIPKYSYIGASISLLILAGAGLIIRLVFIHSLLEKRPNFLEILYRPALASIFMGIAIFFSTGIHLFFRLLLAGIVYGIMLLILGEFKKGEYRELKELVFNIIKRGSNEVSSDG